MRFLNWDLFPGLGPLRLTGSLAGWLLGLIAISRRSYNQLSALKLGERGKPKTIVSDNGTELTSNAILRWADDQKVAWHYIAPSKREGAGPLFALWNPVIPNSLIIIK